MGKKKVEETVEEILMPITEKLGLNLIDIEYKKEGNNYVLRTIIDKPEGIVIDDCENVSRELDKKLDEIDPIPHEYYLEVQSPGERVLRKDREFEYFKGRDVEVKLYEALEGRKAFEGKLSTRSADSVFIISENGETKGFPLDKVSAVKLKIKI